MKWLHFGRWPSSHDIDLVLDAEGSDAYERCEKLVEHLNPEIGETMKVIGDAKMAALPLPESLIAQAIAAAAGLPIDAFLVPNPDDFSVVAWSEPPYGVWQVGWAPTLNKYFFDGAAPLLDALKYTRPCILP